MNYKIEVTSYFKRQTKRLLKKYPSLTIELNDLVTSLELHPDQGTALGNKCYKIRVAIASKGKGKSGGARVITHVQIIQTRVYLLSIYDKSDQPDISEKELQSLLSYIP